MIVAVALGRIHRLVGDVDEAVDVRPVLRIQGNAQAGADLMAGIAEAERLGQLLQNLLADHLRLLVRALVPCQTLDNHHELIAAQPRHHVGFAQRLQQALRRADQYLVANGMAVLVVDLLETV